MNPPTPLMPEPDAGASALPAAFALGLTRRYVTPPLALSCVVSVAAMASFLDLVVPLEGALGEVLNPSFDRFLGNAFSTAIVVVFLSAAVYAALQALGVAVDRNRLGFLDSPSRSRSSGLAPLVALLSGRIVRPDTGADDREAAVDDDPYTVGERYGLQRRRYVDRGLAPLRYAAWVLPLLGFIGTVVGISDSIAGLGSVIADGGGGQAAEGLMKVLDGLRFAFDTTLLGLAAVIPVMAFLMILERIEDTLTGQGRDRVQALLAAPAPGAAGNDRDAAPAVQEREEAAGTGGPGT